MSEPELLNRTIGGYQLVGKLGGGGVAEVFRARQPAAGAPDVAIKVIFPEFARQPGVAANFAQITRAAAQLASHPHILPVLGSGEDHEALYIVTPLVEEGSLARWMAKGQRLNASDVGPFFQQLCGAVSYAHSLGVMHGNIKPSNIFLFEGRHVLLGDFGLLWDVRALDPSWSGSDVAAFEFLAPEVFEGRATPASDIYSLGATLYATLTGHAPFQAQRLGDLIAAAAHQEPPSLAQTPTLSGPVVALDSVVRQAMAKQPEQRFGAATALAQSIEGTLLQAPPTAQLIPPAPPQPGQQAPWNAGALGASPLAPGLGSPGAPFGQPLAPYQPIPPAIAVPPVAEPGVSAPFGSAGAGAPFSVAPGQFSAALGPGVEGPTARVPAPPQDISREPTGLLEQDEATARGLGQSLPAVIPPAAQPPTPPSLQAPATPPVGKSAQKDFSATKLELPRLSTPNMANLPDGWQDLLTNDSARARHDPFAASEGELAPLPSVSELIPIALLPGEKLGDARGPIGPNSKPGTRGARADYDIDAMTSERAAVRAAPQAVIDADGAPGKTSASKKKSKKAELSQDTFQAQKVWTNSHTIVRGKRRSKAPFVIILSLLLLTALELSGLAIMRPDICVTHACTIVAEKVRKYVPIRSMPGITAAVQINPGAPAVAAVVGSTSQTQFMLINTSADPITWSAATTLNWLTITPAQGKLPGHGKTQLSAIAKPYGVAPGIYTGGITIAANYGQVIEPIVATVKPAGQLVVAQQTLAIDQCGSPESVTLQNTGSESLSFHATPSQNDALAVSPDSGTLKPNASTALQVTVSCGAPNGTYAVIIVSNGGSQTVIITY